MRIIIPIIAALCLLSSPLSAQGNHDGTFRLIAEESHYDVGDTVRVGVQLEGVTNLLSLQYAVKWDSTLLRFSKITLPQPAVLPSLQADVNFSTNANSPNIPKGQVNLSWLSPDVSLGDPLPATPSTLYYVELIAKSCGTVELSIQDIHFFITIEIGILDENGLLKRGNFNFVPETVTLNCQSEDAELLIIPDSDQVEKDELLYVDVVANRFPQVIGLQWENFWDPEQYSLVAVEIPASSPLTNLTEGMHLVHASNSLLPEGRIRLQWYEPSLNAIGIPDSAVLYTFVLQARECGLSALWSTDDQDAYTKEVVNAVGQAIELQNTNAEVVIDGNCEELVYEEVYLSLPDTIAYRNEVFCMPVRAADYTDIAGHLFYLAYDPEQLEFEEVKNFTPLLPQYHAGQIGHLQSDADPLNYLEVIYNDNTQSAWNLPDETVLFEACFTPQPDAGHCTQISFASPSWRPIDYEFTNYTGHFKPGVFQAATVSIPTELSMQLCESESMVINQTVYNAENSYGMETMASSSCDSIVIVNLEFLPTDTTYVEEELAVGEAITLGGQTFDSPGEYEVWLSSELGCDSLVVLSLVSVTANQEAASPLLSRKLSLQQILQTAPDQYPDNELRIFDALGRQVFYAQPYTGQEIDFSRLASGVYYYAFRPSVHHTLYVRGAEAMVR